MADVGGDGVWLKASVFGGDVLRARYKTRHDVRGRGGQLLHAQTAGSPVGQDVVDGLNVSMQKPGACPAGGFKNRSGGGVLRFVPVRSSWQPGDQSGRLEPEIRIGVAIRRKRCCFVGRGVVPLGRRVNGKAGSCKDACQGLLGFAVCQGTPSLRKADSHYQDSKSAYLYHQSNSP